MATADAFKWHVGNCVFALVLKTKGIAVLICRFVLTPWPETVLIYIKLKYFTAFVLMDEILLKG